MKTWRLEGNLSLSLLGGKLVLFEFENAGEVERVLQEGEWVYKQRIIPLNKWGLEVGCLSNEVQVKIV